MNKLDKEKSTTEIPTEIIDVLMSELSGSELKVLLTISRSNNVNHKEQDKITFNQIIETTGLTKITVNKALRQLIQKKIIKKNEKVVHYEYLDVELDQKELNCAEKKSEGIQKSDQKMDRKRDAQKKTSKKNKNTDFFIVDSLKNI